MTPKTEIRYSWIYNKIFNKDFTRQDFIKLKDDCKKFEEVYNKYITKILELIEENHKKEWMYKFIPIYILRDAPKSFSDPLTVKYAENENMMLVILTHELLHNNFVGKWDFKNSEDLHKYMEPILNKIISKLPLDLSEELRLFNEKTMNLAKTK